MLIPLHLTSKMAALLLSFICSSAVAEVVTVVSARSTVTTLSRGQIADIFLGKSNRFPDGSKAVPVDQIEGSALRDEFYIEVAGKSSAQLKAHWAKIIFTGRGQPPKEMVSSAETKKFVAENPNAIGYIEEKMLDGSLKAVLQIDQSRP